MNELKTGFNKYTSSELLVFAGGVINALSTAPGSVIFAAVIPATSALVTAKNAYSESLDLETSKSVTLVRNARREELTTLLQQAAQSCQIIASGNMEELGHSGFEFRKVPEHSHLPPEVPGNLRLKAGPASGGITAKVNPSAHADSYEMQTAADNINGPWSASTPHTNSQNMEKGGLTRGQDVFVRIRAIGSNGPSQWSDIAGIMVV